MDEPVRARATWILPMLRVSSVFENSIVGLAFKDQFPAVVVRWWHPLKSGRSVLDLIRNACQVLLTVPQWLLFPPLPLTSYDNSFSSLALDTTDTRTRLRNASIVADRDCSWLEH